MNLEIKSYEQITMENKIDPAYMPTFTPACSIIEEGKKEDSVEPQKGEEVKEGKEDVKEENPLPRWNPPQVFKIPSIEDFKITIEELLALGRPPSSQCIEIDNESIGETDEDDEDNNDEEENDKLDESNKLAFSILESLIDSSFADDLQQYKSCVQEYLQLDDEVMNKVYKYDVLIGLLKPKTPKCPSPKYFHGKVLTPLQPEEVKEEAKTDSQENFKEVIESLLKTNKQLLAEVNNLKIELKALPRSHSSVENVKCEDEDGDMDRDMHQKTPVSVPLEEEVVDKKVHLRNLIAKDIYEKGCKINKDDILIKNKWVFFKLSENSTIPALLQEHYAAKYAKTRDLWYVSKQLLEKSLM